MAKMLHPLEVRQSIHSSRNKLSHRQDAIPIRIQRRENGINDFLCLFRMNLHRPRFLSTLLVMYSVDGFQLVHVQYSIPI